MDIHDELPPPVAALFPDRGTRERMDDRLTRALADAMERVLHGPVVPDIDMVEFRRQLAACDFGEPRPLEALIDWAIGALEHGTVHMTHPRYLGLFNPPPTFRPSARTASPAPSIRSSRARAPRPRRSRSSST